MKKFSSMLLYALVLVTPRLSFSGGIVTTPTEQSLRTALSGGGNVTFKFNGTIVLQQTLRITKDTVIDGTGHSVALSGSHAVRVLTVPPGVSLTLSNLTIKDGHSVGLNSSMGPVGAGGGVWVGGTLFVHGCHFWTNMATGGVYDGTGAEANGGAIYVDRGRLYVSDSEFVGNSVSGGSGSEVYIQAGNGSGGAVYQKSGTAYLNNCEFKRNDVSGGMGGGGENPQSGDASGGALCSISSTLTLRSCLFESNSGFSPPPVPGIAGVGGQVVGGAVSCIEGKTVLDRVNFVSNSVTGGSSVRYSAPGFGLGGALYTVGSLAATNSCFYGNSATGGTGSSSGQEGSGGALYNAGSAMLVNCQIASNHVTGAYGWQGGMFTSSANGTGGGIYNAGDLVSLGSTFNSNYAQGVPGGVWGLPASPQPGSDGLGGAIFNIGSFFATNSTFAGNVAYGGPGGQYSDGGDGFGGALDNEGDVVLAFCTFSFNAAVGGLGSANGTGYGNSLFTAGTTTLDSCLLLSSSSGDNNVGPVMDGGHNLCSDASCDFYEDGSMNSIDPKLGPLGNNGGPTPACALLPGSPAIDAGNPSTAPSTDQRGEPRLARAAPDIGAFELGSAPLIHGERTGKSLTLSFNAKANQRYRLQVSTNLMTWTSVATILPTTTGPLNFIRPMTTNRSEFYRLVTP